MSAAMGHFGPEFYIIHVLDCLLLYPSKDSIINTTIAHLHKVHSLILRGRYPRKWNFYLYIIFLALHVQYISTCMTKCWQLVVTRFDLESYHNIFNLKILLCQSVLLLKRIVFFFKWLMSIYSDTTKAAFFVFTLSGYFDGSTNYVCKSKNPLYSNKGHKVKKRHRLCENKFSHTQNWVDWLIRWKTYLF